MKPAMYSMRPWPKGCSGSAFFAESLKPSIEIMEEAASDKLLNASATIAIDDDIVPAMNFAVKSKMLRKTPNPPHRMPYFLRTSGFL